MKVKLMKKGNNNPIIFIDPNGMDIWEINDKGTVVNYEETKEYDMIRMQL